MGLSKKNIIAVLLIAIILAVNTLTVVRLIRYFSPSSGDTTEDTAEKGQKYDDVFSGPDSITLLGNGKTVSFSSGEDYDYIIRENRKRGDYADFYTEVSTIAEENDIWIEYHYDGGREMVLPLSDGLKTVTVEKIKFKLIGDYHGRFAVVTDEGTLILGDLNVNLDLIDRVKSLLNE